MTRDEYREVRDIFVEAQEKIQEAMGVFYDLALDHGIDTGPPGDDVFRPHIGAQMEDKGLWIGKELMTLENTENTLFTLIGKAQVRT